MKNMKRLEGFFYYCLLPKTKNKGDEDGGNEEKDEKEWG